MPTEAERRDIVTIATALLSVYGTGDSRVSESMFVLDEVDFPLSCDVELEFATDSVATVIAVLATFRLSVEAAAVVVAYVAETGHVSGSEVDLGRLRELANGEPLVGLELTYVGVGSFLSRWTLDPRMKDGRKHLLQLAGLAALGVKFFVTMDPLDALGIVIKVTAIVNEVFTTDQVRALGPEPVPSLDSVPEAPAPATGIKTTILAEPLSGGMAEVEAAELARQAAAAQSHELEQREIADKNRELLKSVVPRIKFRGEGTIHTG